MRSNLPVFSPPVVMGAGIGMTINLPGYSILVTQYYFNRE